MSSISSIALSALVAYGVKQAVTANNIANANSADFKPSSLIMKERTPAGVSFSLTDGTDSVDISREAVTMLAIQQGIEASVATFHADDEMAEELLNELQ